MCIPILVTTFPEWLSGTEPLPHTPGAVRPSSCFVVFCVHMHSIASLIRRTPPPTFSDTAITDRHSDTTIFQLRAHWVRVSWSIGSDKSCPRWESNPRLPAYIKFSNVLYAKTLPFFTKNCEELLQELLQFLSKNVNTLDLRPTRKLKVFSNNGTVIIKKLP